MPVQHVPYRRRNSLRLRGFDYSWNGMYFITCVTKDRFDFFGQIENDKVELSNIGKVIEQEWVKTSDIRKEITLGEFIIMPNHFHALVLINKKTVRAHAHAPQLGYTVKNKFGPQSKNLSALIRSFKASCTRIIRSKFDSNFSWQRGFHDRIVRDQKELKRIEDYIINNPLKFSIDNYPSKIF